MRSDRAAPCLTTSASRSRSCSPAFRRGCSSSSRSRSRACRATAIALAVVTHGLFVAYCAYYVYSRTTLRLRTVSNLLDAMVHGDYSLRATPAAPQDNLSELIELINRLANTLSEQKLETRESQLLLHRVIAPVDFAILIVDDAGRIAVANPTRRDCSRRMKATSSGALPTRSA